VRKLRPEGPARTSLFEDFDMHDEWGEDKARQAGGADSSDYSTIFLPWGPKFTAQKCRKMMYTKDMILNSKWYDPNKKHHTHPCFFGTIKEVMGDCCGSCPPVPLEEIEAHASMYVEGNVRWITVNPGQQNARIGSFHPITEGDWTEGAYISKEAESLFIAVNTDNPSAVQNCLSSGIEVSSKDALGRTALHIAAFCNASRVVKILIDSGVRISSKLPDGRTALHVAAQYGSEEIVYMILQKIVKI